MTTDAAPPIFTVGHSNHAPEAFLALLRAHGVEVVADVRSSPYNRNPYTSHFNREALAATLEREGIRYAYYGDRLGGRPAALALYDADGRLQYDRAARTDEFREGALDLLHSAESNRVALMCAEKEPLDCHRTLLVAQELTSAYGVSGDRVRHILADGNTEPHTEAMRRLLDGARSHARQTNLFDDQPRAGHDVAAALIERAVRERAGRVAYRWAAEISGAYDEEDEGT